jgi:GWxTD domain-containing protein
MSVLESLVATPMAAAVGWALLHSLWEGAIVSVALAFALTVMKSARGRYAAACIVMLAMLGGFAFTLVRLAPSGMVGAHAAGWQAAPAWNGSAGMDSGGALGPSLAAVVPWLAPFWIAGVCMFYLWHVMSWISVCRLRRRGVCAAPGEWQARIVSLSAQLRLSRPVQLLESCLVNTPIVLGHFRPVILMPIGLLAGMPPGQIEAILLHELAHVRRYDYLVNVLQRSVEGLLFYHPAVWWISHVIRVEREHLCDDAVVEVNGDAYEYAAALAALEESRWRGREPALAATGGGLVKRVRRLLYPRSHNGVWMPVISMAVTMLVATVALTAWQAPQRQAAEGETPYMKWLNEDIVYLISARERESFMLLGSDAGREKFIEQFWLRRDPTPGTEVNEMKEEHYRRIAYANERFGGESVPGWRTDRGRVFILCGPPDEKEVHPAGGRHQFATELWLYKWFEGVGSNVKITFIDRTGKGDFRVEPGRGN